MSLTDDNEIEAPAEPDDAVDELAARAESLIPEEEREAYEEMVARLRSSFGLEEEESTLPDEPVGGDQPVAEAEEEEAEPPAAPPEPVAASDEWITIDGQTLPTAEARSMLELRRYLANNPSRAQDVAKLIRGESEPPPPPEPVTPEIPAWLDQDDPQAMGLWQSFTAIANRQAQTDAERKAEAERARASQAQNDARGAMATFKAQHPELSDDDLDTVRLHAVAMELVDSLAKRLGGEAGTLKALDIAYKDHPTFIARARGEETPAEKRVSQNQEKRRKISALSGSSGSEARTEPRPNLSSDHQARQEAIKWVQENGYGT